MRWLRAVVIFATVMMLVCAFATAFALLGSEPVRVGHSVLVDWYVPAVHTAVTAACPDDMVEVRGDYCPVVTQTCLEGNAERRCARFAPSVCRGLRVPMHYCIDRYEYPNVAGQRPMSWVSGNAARVLAGDKRLCTREEWTFACEGEAMQPYPYYPGQVRRDVCNHDNKPPNVFLARHPGDPMAVRLDALLVPAGSMPDCVSPFGVYDQVGNIDEWVEGGLMGGHVFGVRNRCRAITTAHPPSWSWYETGTRLCREVL